MNFLFTYYEIFTNGYVDLILPFFSIIAIICGIFVIISKNPIVSVLFLIGLFLSIAGYLMILGINFIGLSYLLVYVGAVSILFLFILMLINIRVSELLSETNKGIPLAIIISVLFNNLMLKVLPSNYYFFFSKSIHIKDYLFSNIYENFYRISSIYNNEILFATSNSWEANLVEIGHITSLGNIMYSSFSMWLILTSIILLLAMVGAIVITIKHQNI